MLKPPDRQHLLQALRPPMGYDLDQAIGTTYSLDLMTLLTVPLAFALFDWEDEEGRPVTDPLALLESTRRYADRIHVFCQAGGIHLPAKPSPLLGQLERMVHAVNPPRDRGVFHPKTWALRFISADKNQPVVYRFLCLSRNLTFDRSWDTILCLEGELVDRDRAFAGNHPLGDFIGALPGLKIRTASPELKKSVQRIQQEIRRVRFTVPDGFDEVVFHPLGLDENRDWFFPGRCQGMFAMSPFVDGQVVNRMLRATSGPRVLVSRIDQLEQLNLSAASSDMDIFTLDPNADGAPDEGATGNPDNVQETLSGLHAKLFITDDGWNSSVWTGSANATTAAFSRNVEFLCELRGKKSAFGVQAFMQRIKNETSFADLLCPFRPPEEPVRTDPDAQSAEDKAEALRRALASADIRGRVTAATTGDVFDFDVRLDDGNVRKVAGSFIVRAWPVTLPPGAAVDALPLTGGGPIAFRGLSFAALSSFVAFEIVSTVGRASHTLRFVINIPVEGFPADRDERMLREILTNRSQVLRYLLLLLADAQGDGDGKPEQVRKALDEDGKRGASPLGELALLEPLLRVLDQQPERLTRIARLVEDLRKSPDGKDLLPAGFLEVWEPIWHVAQKLAPK